MVSVPIRLDPVFAAMVNVTVPFPDPLAPDVIVSQAALLIAVHVQPLPAVTATGVPAPPAEPIDWDVGLIDGAHGAPAAAWVTVNVPPAMVSVPVRLDPVFVAMLNVTVPFPVPVAPDVIVSQAALLVAVHAQPLPAVTATGVPAPPAA